VTAQAFALLIDGSTIEIRDARPADFEAVWAMHAALTPANAYLRFFSMSPLNAEREAARVCRERGPDHAALLAWLGGELAGVASYELTRRPGTAEIAFAVPDHLHGRGIATLLLDHLVSVARQRHLTSFTAEVLPENTPMLSVMADAGLPVQRKFIAGDIQLTCRLPAGEADENLGNYLDSVAFRESRADVASLRHLLRPASIAVIGASRHRRSPGREILHNLVTAGFGGPIYSVHPRAKSMEGLHCLPRVADLPADVDLAVIAVPAAAVPQVAAECGRQGVKSLVVIGSGLGTRGADLLAICRRYGMRLVGPGSFGVATPGLGLDATFGAEPAVSGEAGVAVQSGGVGVAVLEQLTRLGIGVSSFAAMGEKYDVSSNDLLTWWEQDGQTKLAVLYVESFGSPRKFARTARRAGRRMPVLAVTPGHTTPGQQALFAQAGIIATHSIDELTGTAALLATQRLPAGPRVAVVSNGGLGKLAADACADHGLQVATLPRTTQRKLAKLLPAGAAVAGPVDTTGTVSAGGFAAALAEVAACDEVDALLTVTVPTAIADLTQALCAVQLAKPLAAVLPGQAEAVQMLPATGSGPPRAGDGAAGSCGGLRALPAYDDPDLAARALGHAAAYHGWLARPPGHVPELDGLHPGDARAVVSSFLAGSPAGGWLPPDAVSGLLAGYGIALAAAGPAGGIEVRIGAVEDPVFGPVVEFGLADAASDVLGDRAARLAPLTGAEAEELIHAVHAAPLLFGYGGGPAVDTTALTGIMLRVSRLADDIPEIAEIDLDQVVAGAAGAYAVAARIRVCPAQSHDPFLRKLR
jgi:acyl-CoA synthetase (NDP forming)/RimJ/RimL family protein N-acetyltransferase